MNGNEPGLVPPGHAGAEGQARCVWLTGLSGAGKSTIARAVHGALRASGVSSVIIDGDELRTQATSPVGFSKADRDANVMRAARLAATLMRRHDVAVCALISPYRETRDAARRLIGPGRFLEVFVNTPLHECAARDPKGLYAAAARGEIAHLTGVDDPYEPPLAPRLTIDTRGTTPERCAATILACVRPRTDRALA